MTKYLLLLWFYIKLALRSLPKLFGGTLIFVFFIGIIAFSANKLLYNDKVIDKINIAIVVPEENILNQTAFSMLLNMDSIKEACDFKIMDEDLAFEKLDKKEVYAVILIPEQFVENILDGQNTPAHIILQKDSGIEAMIFKLFADSGATILSSAQSGIYAVTDLLLSYDMKENIPEMEDELNNNYLTHAINRNIYFTSTMVSATGDLSILQYYLSSGLVLFGLLSGISCYNILKKESASLNLLLKIRGIPYAWLVLCKLLSVSLLYFFIIQIGLLVSGYSFTFYKALLIFLLILSIVSLILYIFQISDHGFTGIMILFILSVSMTFISGGFIPSAFLPEQIRSLSEFLPTTFWIRQVGYLMNTNTI
ncbi:MAG: ABC transporter permease [Clostridiales bacterium]|nr:ABC transporter permease [Clostridiales bacterium]